MSDSPSPPAPSAGAASRSPAQFLLVTLLVLVGLQALVIAAFWLRWLFVPNRVEAVELAVVNAVEVWRRGVLPYTWLRTLPVAWSPYGPLYQWLCAQLPPLPGNVFFPGRLVSLLAGGGLLALITAWGRARGSTAAGVLGALLFLTSRPAVQYVPVYRVDTLAVLCTTLAVLALTTPCCRSRLGTGWGLVLETLAFATKFNALGAPAVVLLSEWKRDRKRALLLALGYALLAGGVFVAMQAVSHGAYFWNTRTGVSAIRPARAVDMAVRPLGSMLWFVAVGLLYRAADPESRSAARPWLIYAGVSWALATLAGINTGSTWNWFLDLYAALGMLTAALLAPALRRGAPTAVLGLLLVYGLINTQTAYRALRGAERGARGWGAEHRSAMQALAPYVREARKLAIVDSNAGLEALLTYGLVDPTWIPLEYVDGDRAALIRQALREGAVDTVLSGKQLRPWTADDGTEPGGSRPH